jgi:hypothetical protein
VIGEFLEFAAFTLGGIGLGMAFDSWKERRELRLDEMERCQYIEVKRKKS